MRLQFVTTIIIFRRTIFYLSFISYLAHVAHFCVLSTSFFSFASFHCIRVLIDFILIAQYRSHDEHTLRYLNHALYRVNFFKSVFRETRQRYINICRLPDALITYSKRAALQHVERVDLEIVRSHVEQDCGSATTTL